MQNTVGTSTSDAYCEAGITLKLLYWRDNT